MKGIKFLVSIVALVAINATSALAEDLPDLHVKGGDVVEITARTYQYRNIRVDKGGQLRIRDRSTRWAILWATGEVVVDGSIEYVNFSSSAAHVMDTTPDMRQITHEFDQVAVGGAGGLGGRSEGGGGTSAGGVGALGTFQYGGGGGSAGGVHILGPSTHIGSRGNDAVDWRGAPPASDGGDEPGGDGGRRDAYANGGLLLIYAPVAFSGSGSIRLTGKNGAHGLRGGNGFVSNRGSEGAGGGGGGAPGGSGGRLIVVTGNHVSDPTYLVDGGKGGAGGQAGDAPRGATAGKQGDDGAAGVVDLMTLDQWRHLPVMPGWILDGSFEANNAAWTTTLAGRGVN